MKALTLREIVDPLLNDEILGSAGSSWDDWEAFSPACRASPVKDGFLERALKALADEFGASRLFVPKDPPICRLLPFWIEAFGAEPHVVCPVRHPMEVAASLERRDGFGRLLRLRHMLDAEAHSRGPRRVFLRYYALLPGWRSLPERLGRQLGVAWPRRSTAADLEIDGFLSPVHRHHVEPDAAVVDDASLSRWIRSSFAVFDRWARGEAREGDCDELDRSRAAFDEAVPAFARPMLAGRQAARRSTTLDGELGATRDRANVIEGLVAAREAQLQDVEARAAMRETGLAERDAALAEAQSRIGELEGAVAGQEAELGEMRQAATERDVSAAALE